VTGELHANLKVKMHCVALGRLPGTLDNEDLLFSASASANACKQTGTENRVMRMPMANPKYGKSFRSLYNSAKKVGFVFRHIHLRIFSRRKYAVNPIMVAGKGNEGVSRCCIFGVLRKQNQT
jgi:hypothetical protein